MSAMHTTLGRWPDSAAVHKKGKQSGVGRKQQTEKGQGGTSQGAANKKRFETT